jgi:hypothetical protein
VHTGVDTSEFIATSFCDGPPSLTHPDNKKTSKEERKGKREGGRKVGKKSETFISRLQVE